jgi:hypothetical protein
LACKTEFGFKNNHKIVELVQQEMKEAEEPESESDKEEEYAAPMPTAQIIELCCQMEQVGESSEDPLGPELATLARKFQGKLLKRSMKTANQSMLDAWMKGKQSSSA